MKKTDKFTQETIEKITQMTQEWRVVAKNPEIYSHFRKEFYFIKLYRGTKSEIKQAQKIAIKHGFNWSRIIDDTSNFANHGFYRDNRLKSLIVHIYYDK